MPLLSTPRILRGAKLATTTTCFPTIAAGSKCIAIPDSMVLFSVPRSTSNCKSLSAFSTFWASIIVPTRKSIFPKSSKTISGFNPLSLASDGPAAGLILSIVVFLALRLLFN